MSVNVPFQVEVEVFKITTDSAELVRVIEPLSVEFAAVVKVNVLGVKASIPFAVSEPVTVIVLPLMLTPSSVSAVPALMVRAAVPEMVAGVVAVIEIGTPDLLNVFDVLKLS